jgi:hypothetical protein
MLEAIMKTKILGAVLVMLSTLILFSNLASGQSVPGLINYQGRLLDSAGLPVNNMSLPMNFSIWDKAQDALDSVTNEPMAMTGISPLTLAHQKLMSGSEVVTAVGGSPAYSTPHDYLINYVNGTISRVEGGWILPDQQVEIDYQWTNRGSSPWSEAQVVEVNNGIYNVRLGGTNPIPAAIFSNYPAYLEVVVDGETLSPRAQMTSVAYAMNAELLGGHPASDFLSTAHTHAFSDISGTADITQVPLAQDADQLDGQPGSFYLDAGNIEAGNLDNSHFSAYADLYDEGYLGNEDDNAILVRCQSDERYAGLFHTHNANDITSGMLRNAFFSAYSNLYTQGYLDGNTATDLVTRVEGDIRYEFKGAGLSCPEGQKCINGAGIQDGTIATSALADNSVTDAKIVSIDATKVQVISGGQLTFAVYDAYQDLINQSYLGSAFDYQLMMRSDSDTRYLTEGRIGTSGLSSAAGNEAVMTNNIRNGAVDSSKIADNSIDSIDIKDGAIQPADLGFSVASGPGSVTTVEIQDGTILHQDLNTGLNAPVDWNNIQDNAVRNAQIQNGAVNSAKVQDGTIVGADMQNGAVGNTQLAANAVQTGNIADGTITSADLQDNAGPNPGAVATIDIQDNAVTAAQLQDQDTVTGTPGAVSNDKLQQNAVTTEKILDGTIQLADLGFSISPGPGSVTTIEILNGTILSADLSSTVGSEPVNTANLRDGAVTSAKILDGTITSVDLQDYTGAGTGAVATIDIQNSAVTTAKIAAGAVTTTELGPNAVTTAKIAAGAVTTTELGPNAVTTSKIAALAVTTTELGPYAVTTTKIAALAVTTTELGANAVTTGKILDGTILNADLSSTVGSEPVNTANIRDGAVTSAKITDGSIDNVDIKDGTITQAKLAFAVVSGPNSVDTTMIVDGTILHSDLATGANAPVDWNNIMNDAVRNAQIQNSAVTSAKIQDGTILSADLSSTVGSEAVATANLRDGAVTSVKIANGAVTANTIADASVTANKIADASVTANKIADASVIAGKIAVNAVTAGNLASSAVMSGNIAPLAVTNGNIQDEAITTSKITAGTITQLWTVSGAADTSTSSNVFADLADMTLALTGHRGGIYLISFNCNFLAQTNPNSVYLSLQIDGVEQVRTKSLTMAASEVGSLPISLAVPLPSGGPDPVVKVRWKVGTSGNTIANNLADGPRRSLTVTEFAR